MFLEIEGEICINLMMITQYILRHAQRKAMVYVGGMLFESEIAYRYLSGPNGKALKITTSE